MTDEIAYHVAIRYTNIRKLAIGLDFGNPCKLFCSSMFSTDSRDRHLF